MKDFLRRTVESARGAEQRVKPLVGSVYAGDSRREEKQKRLWGEESIYLPGSTHQTAPTRGPSQPETARAESPVTPEALLPVTAERHEKPAKIQMQSSEADLAPLRTDSFPALFAVASDHPARIQSPSDRISAKDAAPLKAPMRLGSAPAPALERNRRSPGEGDDAQAREQFSAADKRSTVAEPRRAEPASRVEPLLRRAVAAKASIAAQVSAPKNRGPEEQPVQIHIGRVEVIAAAPQVVRTPTPRPSRASSLADYLAGRNGRFS